MYLIGFTIFVILVVLLFYRRERLEYDEFGFLSFETRRDYEEKMEAVGMIVSPILNELANSSYAEIINDKRQTMYGTKLDEVKAKLEEFDKVNAPNIPNTPLLGKSVVFLTDPELIRQRKELLEQIHELGSEINKPITLIEAISIDSPYLDALKIHTNTLGNIPDLLIKDNELRMQQEKELEESMKSLQATPVQKESTMERLMRKQKERTAARKKAKEEEELAKARQASRPPEMTLAQAQSQTQARTQTQAQSQSQTRTQTQVQSQVQSQAQTQARTIMTDEDVAQTEKDKIQEEEIFKVQNARDEAESVMNQLREIPLEERIRRKIFVQPKLDHKPYPYVMSRPANRPYDTTKYEKRENLFKPSEISSIFPQVKLSNT